MDLTEIKAWRENRLTCVSGQSAEVIDWLIAKVERLIAALEAAKEEIDAGDKECTDLNLKCVGYLARIISVNAERDRYEAELDQIAKLPDDYPLSAVKHKATAAVGYYRKDNKGRKR